MGPGSFREVARGDVLLALAAVIYVRSPFDVHPDHLFGGLSDDESVVRWVSDQIADTLVAYEQWEGSLGEDQPTLVEPTSEPQLGGLPETLNVRVLDAADSALFLGAVAARTQASGGHQSRGALSPRGAGPRA